MTSVSGIHQCYKAVVAIPKATLAHSSMNQEANEMFTCPNPSCGRVFATPLNTLNPQDSAKPYPACPYCLTKITEPQTGYIRNEAQDEDHPGKEQSETKDKPQDCRHYKGYLSERKDKQQIPDDCITCRAILDCMLQKMKAET